MSPANDDSLAATRAELAAFLELAHGPNPGTPTAGVGRRIEGLIAEACSLTPANMPGEIEMLDLIFLTSADVLGESQILGLQQIRLALSGRVIG
jgi:hypothetical protein